MDLQNMIDEVYEKVYREVYEKGYADGKRDCESTKAEKHEIDLGMVLVEAGIMNDKEISSFYIGRYPITRKEWFEIYPEKMMIKVNCIGQLQMFLGTMQLIIATTEV